MENGPRSTYGWPRLLFIMCRFPPQQTPTITQPWNTLNTTADYSQGCFQDIRQTFAKFSYTLLLGKCILITLTLAV